MDYKTPAKQLVNFFNSSRNKWKEKCLKSKDEIKLLKKKLEYHAGKNKEHQATIKVLQREITTIKKKNLKQ